jgi:hypothetical protein
MTDIYRYKSIIDERAGTSRSPYEKEENGT